MPADPVAEAADRLYGLPLEEFTRERDARAKELRAAKDREAAAQVGKLPKPSQVAWTANQLARTQRELLDGLLGAGAELRQAQLGTGDRSSLRAAAAAEREAVEALLRAAEALRPNGRTPSRALLDGLRSLLHAAAGDEQLRDLLAAGRVVAEPEAGGAWPLGAFSAAPAPASAPASRRAKRARTTAAEQRREELERRKQEEARRREQERRAAEERRRLERRLATAREKADEARMRRDAAQEAYEAACHEVARIEEQLT